MVAVLLAVAGVAVYPVLRWWTGAADRRAAQAAMARGDYQQAADQFQRYLERNPDDVAALDDYARATLLIEPRRPEHVAAAIRTYERILERQPFDTVAGDRLMALLLHTGKPRETESLARTQLEADPRDLAARLALGRALEQMHRFDECRSVLQELIHADPGMVEAYVALAECPPAGDVAQLERSALEALDTAILQNLDSALARARRGLFHTERPTRDVSAAHADLLIAQAMRPADTRTVLLLACGWMNLGQYETAAATLALESPERDAEHAITADADRYWRCRIEAEIALRTGEARLRDKIDELLRPLSGKYRVMFLPTAVEMCLATGDVSRARSLREAYIEGIAQFEQVGDPQMTLALLDARLALAEHRPYAAIERLEPIVSRDPAARDARTLLAQACEQAGQRSRARRLYEQVCRRWPDDAVATERLARIYLAQRRPLDALRLLRCGYVLGPQGPGPALLELQAAVQATPIAELRPDELRAARREVICLADDASGRVDARQLLEWLAALEQQGTHSRPAVPASAPETPAQIALEQLTSGRRDAAIAHLAQHADRNFEDATTRLLLLAAPETHADPRHAMQLVDQIRATEGDYGLRWKSARAACLARTPGWREHEADIIALLNTCITADPGWADPRVELGRLHERLGRPADAEIAFREALRAEPDHAGAADALFALLVRQGRLAEADDVLARVPLLPAAVWPSPLPGPDVDAEAAECSDLELRARLDPRDADACVRAARRYTLRGDPGRALELLDQFDGTSAPDLVLPAWTRALILRAAGREDAALASLQTLANTGPAAALLRARGLLLVGRSDEAAEAYRTLASAHGDQGRRLLAGFHLEQGGAREAAGLLEGALRGAPDDVDLQARLAAARAEFADPHCAAGLDELHTKAPADPRVCYARGVYLLKEGSSDAWARGVAELERGIDLDPGNARLHARLLDALLQAGRLRDATRAAERALQACPDSPPLLRRYARIEQRSQRFTLARRALERAIALDPRDIEARRIGVEVALAAGRPGEAERLNNQVLRLRPDDRDALLAHAAILDAGGDRYTAIRAVEALVGSDLSRASDARALLLLAELNRKAGRQHEVERIVRRLQQIAPDHPDLLTLRLRELAAQEAYDAIAMELTNRFDALPVQLDGLVVGAALLARSDDPGDIRRARPFIDKFIAARPARVEGYLGRAQVCERLEDLTGAHRAYLQALAADPRHPRVLNNLAWFLAHRLEMPDAALEFASAAVREAPDDPHRLHTRGAILLDLGRPTAAREDLESSVELAVYAPATRIDSLALLAKVYEHLGRADDARRCAAQTLELDRQFRVLGPHRREAMERLSAGPSGERRSER